MLDMARERLEPLGHRVDLRHGDFRTLPAHLGPGDGIRVVISAYALHHLNREEKRDVVGACVEALAPGGWFLNADNIVGNTSSLERRFQQLRVAAILAGAAGSFSKLTTPEEVRAYLDDLERNEGDQPLRLAEDLAILEDAGLEPVGAFWLEFREAVTGGIKPEP